MEYVNLGRSGLKVSELCMGTMTFGGQADEEESAEMVRMCLDAGINFFDTANVYNDGRSEQIVGQALQDERDRVVLATKVRGRRGPAPNQVGLSRRHILEEVENSLRRLRTDHVDLYQLHQPDYDTPIEETMAAMDRLVRQGKVRYVGVSNYAAWQILQAQNFCTANGLAPIVSVQPMYNLIARGVEQELLPFCRQYGVGVIPYNPLAGGLLTGKHDRRKPPADDTRFDRKGTYRERYWHARMFDAVEALEDIAQEAGRSMVELSLQWLVSRREVTSVILGASRPEQLREDLEACAGELPEGVAEQCDDVWERLRGPIPMYNR
ncbi:MAG: aldo/keto reductase [Planctomycetota bacterium]